MILGRNQEEILKLHALRRHTLTELDTPAFPKEESDCVPQLHACKMDAETGAGTGAKGVESGFGVWRLGFGGGSWGGDPAVGVEAKGCQLD